MRAQFKWNVNYFQCKLTHIHFFRFQSKVFYFFSWINIKKRKWHECKPFEKQYIVSTSIGFCLQRTQLFFRTRILFERFYSGFFVKRVEISSFKLIFRQVSWNAADVTGWRFRCCFGWILRMVYVLRSGLIDTKQHTFLLDDASRDMKLLFECATVQSVDIHFELN